MFLGLIYVRISVALGINQWRAEGGANGAQATGIQGKGASKEWNYKNLNAAIRWFFILCVDYMLNGCDFSKLVLLSTLAFTYSDSSNPQLLHCQGLLIYVYGARPIKLKVTRLVLDRGIKENHKKGLKYSQAWEKPVFLKNPTLLLFSIQAFFNRCRFLFFFQKNTKIPFWIVFIALCNITISRITQ